MGDRGVGPRVIGEELVKLFDVCSNQNRWGPNDELGTLNYITDAKRVKAAQLVRSGERVAIGRTMATQLNPSGHSSAMHLMLLEQNPQISAADYFGVASHGIEVTHLDAVAHMYWEGHAYNGRRSSEILSKNGLTFGSINAQCGGVVTRGVLLDVAAVRDKRWLEPTDWVTPEDLEAAEERENVTVGTGDGVFIYAGVEERQANESPDDGVHRTGVEANVVRWIHDRQIALYSGDCRDFMPYPDQRVPLPLHQIGLVAMGLCMLDIPSLTELVQVCERLGRYEFLLTCSPLKLPGATGSPVNPVCVF